MPNTPTETRITVATLAIDLKYIRDKIDGLCDDSKTQDKRLDNVERVTWAGGIITSLLAAIFIPIAIAAIKKWVGL
jgi:hypothetical protein